MTKEKAVQAATAGAVVLVLLLVVGWAVDAAASAGEVRRNVQLAGQPIGGLDRAGFATVMDQLDSTLGATPIVVATSEQPLQSTLGALGVRIDREATTAHAMDTGRRGFFLFGPLRTLRSFVGHRDAPVAITVDTVVATAAINELAAPIRDDAVEPSLAFQDGFLRTVAGVTGSRLDDADLLAQLQALDGNHLDGGTITLQGKFIPLPPTRTDAAADSMLTRLEVLLDRSIAVSIAGTKSTIDATELAPFVTAGLVGDNQLTIQLDQARTLGYLAETFAGLATEPSAPDISVSSGKVVIGYAKPGTVCCSPESVAALAGVLQGGDRSVTLTMAEVKPEKDTAHYQKLGIVELVSSFTTQHPCCAARVDNLHRMADLVGPRVIEPGESFSLNDTVGRRTLAKGFKAAPTIDGAGNFVDDVGGGVSQFSTTLFNAAFFAGLEIDEYMAHGLYISRYPYGREATLNFPHPDLVVTNNTAYGVLIWPTYTDTSITVSLYSTKNVEATQSNQTEATYGAVCTEVTTYRTRTWLSTRKTEVDKFYALYGPAEGVQCDGTVIPKDGVTTTTTPAPTTTPPTQPPATTAPPPPTTAPPPSSTVPPTTTSGGSS